MEYPPKPQYDCRECYARYLEIGEVHQDCNKFKQYEEIGLNKDGICARIELFKMNGVKPKKVKKQPEEHYLDYLPFGRGTQEYLKK